MSTRVVLNHFTGNFELVHNGPDRVDPSTDNAIVRFDGIAGEQQNSNILIDDNGEITLPDLYGVGDNFITGDWGMRFDVGLAFDTTKTAYNFDTKSYFNQAGTPLMVVSNFGSERFKVDKDGWGFIGQTNNVTQGFAIGQNNISSAPATLAAGYSNQTTSIGAAAFGLSCVSGGAYSFTAGLSNQTEAFFSTGIGLNNILSVGAGGSVAIGGGNKVNSGFSATFGINNTMYGLNTAVVGSNLLMENVTLSAAMGAGWSATNPMVLSRPQAFSVGAGKKYPGLHSESDKRSYIETPNFGIFSDQTLSMERVANGSFTGSATGWTLGTGWAYTTNQVEKNADGTGTLSQPITLELGAAYLLSYDLTTTVADQTIEVSLPTQGITLTKRRLSNTGNTDVFIATSTTDTLTFTPSNASRFVIDNVSIQKMTEGQLSVAGESWLNGGAWLKRKADTFGFTNNYTTLVLDGDINGAGMYYGRSNDSNLPFAGVSGWDSGASREIFYGGGGWDVPDATTHGFYTADTYNETNNTGTQRLRIHKDGYVLVSDQTAGKANNIPFQIYAYGSFDGGMSFTGFGPAAPVYNFGPDESDSRHFKFEKTTGATGLGSGTNIWTFDRTNDEFSHNLPVKVMTGTTTQAPLNFPNATALKTTPADGDMEYMDGHWYVTNGARHVLSTCAGVKTTTTTVTNTTTETQVYAYTFAANELHADERIRFTMDGVYSNASASDDFTIRFKVGGVTVHSIARSGGNVTDAGWEAVYKGTIRTDGASGTFVDFAKFLDGTNSYAVGETTTHSIDTTGTVLFEVTVQWDAAKAGNTFSCTQGDLAFKH